MSAVLIQNAFAGMVNPRGSTYTDDAKMLSDVPFLMNQIITDQLAFSLVTFVLITHYLYYVIRYYDLQKLGRLTTQELPRCGL